MSPATDSANRPRRRYDATRRRAQARRTREAVHRAAFVLFSEQGYGRTTLPQIAAAADVSVETVRKMGPKSALLDGARMVGVFDTADLEQIGDAGFMQAVAAAGTLFEAIEVLVEFYATSNARAGGFWVAWRAAALDDPAVARAWAQEMASAHEAFRAGIRLARERGWLRTDVADAELVATLWLLASAETHQRLTADAGLDDEAYRRWLRRSLLEQLGAPGGGADLPAGIM